jgi:cyclopropane-fatty-acyl-phospholipid synthase
MSAAAAQALWPLMEQVFRGPPPIRLRAWDGSEAGAGGHGPTVVLRSRRALRHLLWSPGELGLARAYVSGDLDVDGDLAEGLGRCWHAVRERGLEGAGLPWRQRLDAGRLALRLGVTGPRPRPPAAEARLAGRLHTRGRDRAAIAHHYDLCNDFYALILGSSMAYSCAYWTSESPGYGLDDAQRDKLALICRKLRLQPGMRLLDIGCGWGSLAVHAARAHGAHVTAVTLSRQQAALAGARAGQATATQAKATPATTAKMAAGTAKMAAGTAKLTAGTAKTTAGTAKTAGAGAEGGSVEVRLQDYREISGGPYDAVASIEMGEHVGADGYGAFARGIRRLVRPGGRVLIQQMSRRTDSAPGGGPFIETYIAPDMHMRPLGATIQLIEDAGLEVRDVQSLREHYVRTIRAWHDVLECQWDQAVALIGEEQARVWRLYLAGGALAFAEGRMGVDQILAVRPRADGDRRLPAVRGEMLAMPGDTPRVKSP